VSADRQSWADAKLSTHPCVLLLLLMTQVHKDGSCPYRPAEKHVHNDAFSNYGAGGCS
jgi:hypothetical protein